MRKSEFGFYYELTGASRCGLYYQVSRTVYDSRTDDCYDYETEVIIPHDEKDIELAICEQLEYMGK